MFGYWIYHKEDKTCIQFHIASASKENLFEEFKFRRNTYAPDVNKKNDLEIENDGVEWMKLNTCVLQRQRMPTVKSAEEQKQKVRELYGNLLPKSLWLGICLKCIIIYNKMKLEVNYVIYLCVPVPALILVGVDFRKKLPERCRRQNSMKSWETRKNAGTARTRAKYRVLTHSHQTWRAYSSIFAFLFSSCEPKAKEAKKHVCCDRVYF